MPHIFCDLDGVMFDFETGFFIMHGIAHNSVKDGRMWQLINSRKRDFWLSLPLMPGAIELWEAIRGYNPTILTGCPPSGFETAAECKRIKVQEHFGDVSVITDLSKNKPIHMKAPGDILIDDMSKNIKRWEEAGGIGILHTDVGTTLTELKKILANVKE